MLIALALLVVCCGAPIVVAATFWVVGKKLSPKDGRQRTDALEARRKLSEEDTKREGEH